MQALVLPIGADRYALELIDVREVVPEPLLTPLPDAPPGVLGLVNVRGDVVPVLDTAALLGLGRLERVEFVAIADAHVGLAGLATDGEPSTAELDEPAGPAEIPCAIERYAVDGAIVT